jgi:hypothetical protein
LYRYSFFFLYELQKGQSRASEWLGIIHFYLLLGRASEEREGRVLVLYERYPKWSRAQAL